MIHKLIFAVIMLFGPFRSFSASVISAAPVKNLKLVFQISRHGNRAPSRIFDHLVAPEHQHLNFKAGEDEKEAGQKHRELQPSGVKQMQLMSQEFIRSRYSQFIDFDINDAKELAEVMQIHSTATSRTIESAKVQARSLLSNLAEEEIEAMIQVAPEAEDHLLHLGTKNCNFLKRMINHAKNSEHQEYIEEFVSYVLINYLREIVKGFTPSPEDLRTNGRAQSIFVTSEDDQLLVDYGPRICGYIYWAQKQAGIPMTFSKDANSQLITRLCEVVVDSKLYRNIHAHEFVASMVPHKLLHEVVLPQMKSVIEESDQAPKRPKYFHFSTHQEQLGPLLHVLGLASFRRTDPGSSLFLELFENEDQEHQLALRYMRDHNTTGYLLKTDFKSFETSITEKYATFHDIFKEKVSSSNTISHVCSSDYINFLNRAENSGHQFMLSSGDAFLKGLAKEHSILDIYKKFKKQFKAMKEEKKEEL